MIGTSNAVTKVWNLVYFHFLCEEINMKKHGVAMILHHQSCIIIIMHLLIWVIFASCTSEFNTVQRLILTWKSSQISFTDIEPTSSSSTLCWNFQWNSIEVDTKSWTVRRKIPIQFVKIEPIHSDIVHSWCNIYIDILLSFTVFRYCNPYFSVSMERRESCQSRR